MKQMVGDGNQAAAMVAYALSEEAAVYPITPSTPMAEYCDEWARQGVPGVLGQKLRLVEMQSEAGAAGALHGMLSAGALSTTFTASQGLLLMLPDMCKIAGELLPGVMHVAARALAYHALSIFGDHSDVMAVRSAGWGMLCAASVQEAADMAVVAHLSALEGSVPMLHFFDGFRTSHEIQRFDMMTTEELRGLMPWEQLQQFRARAMNPAHPHQQGTSQNPDIYFQGREAANPYYLALPQTVQRVMERVSHVTGRELHLFDYTGAPDATRVLVMMGSGAKTAAETVRALQAQGEKVGVVQVRLFRPFSGEYLLAALPETTEAIAVLDRTKESGAIGEPLYLDVCAAVQASGRRVRMCGGRYGLGSKEFTPAQVKAVFDFLRNNENGAHFTVGIEDDVTHLSLPVDASFTLPQEGITSCKFYGIGSDGTVGANKSAIALIAAHTKHAVQAYFSYDSKKSGGYTVSHLRIGEGEIHAPYLIGEADFLACHQPTLLALPVVAQSVKENGTVLLNLPEGQAIPETLCRAMAKKHATLYVIDAGKIAASCGLGGRINWVMQTCFFLLNAFLPEEDCLPILRHAVEKAYGKKGKEVVEKNWQAIEQTRAALRKVEVLAEWATLPETQTRERTMIQAILHQQGDTLPVSVMDARGYAPTGTSRLEKRGIARQLPVWVMEHCIQCGRCSLVCPHACIRPFYPARTEELPETFAVKKAVGKDFAGHMYRIQVSPLDCTGCGSCESVCPAKEKALVMRPKEEAMQEVANWETAMRLPPNPRVECRTIPLSQARTPLFEFSGACAGCGETPYIKLLTQLFGTRLLIANATGCSSIYGGSAPTCPYTVDENGKGPAWANSLFEDNAEFGLGLRVAIRQRRMALAETVERLAAQCPEVSQACHEWLANWEDGDKSEEAGQKLFSACQQQTHALAQEVVRAQDLLGEKSVWLLGGDGWAYDIGYGGLDHVLASGENVNVLVLDTEVYSNTGGQASKATPRGAAARLMSGGKEGAKKDLGLMAMTYGHVYVAQVAMGADSNQLLRAMREAEAWHGPSLVIAYAPCIAHGINMRDVQAVEKEAVQCGYFPLYRFLPQEGRLVLDSAEPTGDFQAFLLHQGRFSVLQRMDAERSEALRRECEADARRKWQLYQQLSGQK